MVKKKNSKRGDKPKKSSEALGISGFTLGVVSLACIVFTPFLGIITSVVGFFMSLSQQRKNPTKFGKRGIILNAIGFILNVAIWFLLIRYLIPIIQQNPII